MRRNYEELVNALRLLEEENKRLRALLEKYRGKEPVQKQVEVVSVKRALAPGHFVEYTPPGGKRGCIPTHAIVLEVKPNGFLKLKVCHVARPDEVLDDVGPDRWRAR
jgi:hypothetical protein